MTVGPDSYMPVTCRPQYVCWFQTEWNPSIKLKCVNNNEVALFINTGDICCIRVNVVVEVGREDGGSYVSVLLCR
jgi:hypothetical protein